MEHGLDSVLEFEVPRSAAPCLQERSISAPLAGLHVYDCDTYFVRWRNGWGASGALGASVHWCIDAVCSYSLKHLNCRIIMIFYR